jgi:hypothetical protein
MVTAVRGSVGGHSDYEAICHDRFHCCTGGWVVLVRNAEHLQHDSHDCARFVGDRVRSDARFGWESGV